MTGWRWVVGLVAVFAIAVGTAAVPPWSHQVVGVAAPVGPAVAQPWAPGKPELGVQLYWVNNPADSDDVVRAKALRLIDHLIGMEANAVAISFPFYAESLTSSELRTDARTPSPDRVAIVADEARLAGLRVTIRPLLDEANFIQADPRAWRGELAPADRKAWFASYSAFLMPYAQMAQIHHVDTVVLGAELTSLQTDPQWSRLAVDVRKRYQGELAYSANWDAHTTALTGVGVRVGVDAYPRLGAPATATQQEFTTTWSAWLESARLGRGDVLYEVGAAAEAEMVVDPAVPYRKGAALDEGIQRRWFAAACSAAHDRGLDGLYWWKMEFDADPTTPNPDSDLHDSWLGRPAEPAMRACFAAWGAPS